MPLATHAKRKWRDRRRRLVRFLERLEDRRLLAALSVWSSSEDSPVFAAEAPQPSDYAAFELDTTNLSPILESAPLEFTLGPEEPADLRPKKLRGELSLPTPDGDLRAFKLQEISIMDADLAAKLPGVATYRGHDQTGEASVRLTLSSRGLHAKVSSPEGDFVVDPIMGDPGGMYMSYYVSSLAPAPGDFFDFDHSHGEDSHEDHGHDGDGDLSDGGDDSSLPPGAPPPVQSTGPELRTYRLAVAATGEFTVRHGGTVASAQAKIVEAINDANDLYEREMAFRFVLVDNSAIVYLDGATDPYTNSDRSAMLNENQTNLDAVIGDANYDIGHVFATSGGGRASVGVVGRTGRKARGVSANNLNFSTQTVSHEIGHQFSSRHTWNGALGSCTASQWNADFSMEPGSGSTIMSYGGFCGADNVVTTRDNYFHSVSYDAIVNYAVNRYPNVGTITATGNTAPIVDAGPDYTIPAQTPFELTPPEAIDNEGDTVTYNWEQRDLGTGQKALASPDDGQGPLFRSYPKSTDRTRTLPRLEELLNNTIPTGEQLPSTNREINFRLTANDGRGGTASDSMVINVVATGAPFTVTSPNSTVDWQAFTEQTVTWNVAGTDSGAISAATVDILLSTDGGETFDTVLASGVANDGSQAVTIPNLPTTDARIKVKPTNNIFFDFSDINFSISAPVLTDDFGDAPAPYPVLAADNGPRHTEGGPRLGTAVDLEIDGQPSSLADGDGADDDGLTLIEPLIAGQTTSVQVSTTTGGELDFFLDFDGDGVFGNTAQEITRVTLPAGSTLVPLTIPADAVGETFARLRISANGGLAATGPATGGEVEDYRLSIFTSPPDVDFGDAKAYATDLANDGARHVVSGLTLGVDIDAESDAAGNTSATGDGRDDDGVVFRELLLTGQSANIDFNASGSGVVDFFIDFDGDGVFGNTSSEVFSQNVSGGWQTVSINVPADASPGITYGRFRISSGGGLGPTGFAFDGEVEDYQLIVSQPGGEILLEDFDSVPAPELPPTWTSTQLGNAWETVAANSDTAPNSVFVSNEDESTDVSLESPTFRVEVDDTVVRFQNWYDLEDSFDGGVLEISVAGGPYQDILDAGALFLSGGYTHELPTGYGNELAFRDAWSGDSGGYIETAVRLPNTLVGSDISLRWRLGTDSSVSAPGWRIDTVSYDGPPFRYDFGDAPDPGYPTLTAMNGAAHVIDGLWLGSTIDEDTDGQPNADASGDDATDLADEDGVVFGGALSEGSNTIQVTSNDDAIVNVWLDLDGNGNWNAAADHVIKDYPVVAGTNDIALNLAGGFVAGNTFARVRLSHQSGLAPDGLAGDGEVEDYRVMLDATPAVDVESVQINDGSIQRSNLNSLAVTFDGQADVDATAFEILNRADGSPIAFSASVGTVNEKTVATLTFGAGPNVVTRATGNSLIDGNFQLNVLAGQIVGMETDHQFGASEADSFFRLFGDSDGDRDVDGQDYGRFGLTFLKQSTDVSFNADLDHDGDNDVDGQDYGNFGLRFLQTLPFGQ